MKIYILNAFSLSMIDRETQSRMVKTSTGILRARVPLPVNDPVQFIQIREAHGAEIISALGHAATQPLFESILGRPVPVNRVNIKLDKDNIALVGQYIGPRLPVGATELPEGACIEWWAI